MSFLLNKRLARSLWRTKIRLVAVILMVVIGVFAGISMGGYATNVSVLYDNIYEDDEEGVNLPDIWVNLPGGTWSEEESQNLCDKFEEDFPVDSRRRLDLELLKSHSYNTILPGSLSLATAVNNSSSPRVALATGQP